MTRRPRPARATVPQHDEELPQLESPPPYTIVYPDSNTQVKPGLKYGQGKSYASIMIEQEAAHAQFWQVIDKMSPQERRAAIVAAARREGLVLAAPIPALAETSSSAAAQPRLMWLRDRREGETAPDFIFRAYAAEREAETLHRGIILNEDRSLYRALYKWLGVAGNALTFDLPTESEWNTRQLAKLHDDPIAREHWRLFHLETTRNTRAHQKT
jgi:hypothetical protein